ncbi:MAG: hypothetical protein K2H84_01985 [Paramuribaculum sp.]|nr:hypothetical protein [Paramuribaculum sp.]
MKKILIFLILILTGISFAEAENQKYVVSNKKGKARFAQVEKDGENWKYVRNAPDIYLDNGVEIEVFEIDPDESLNYPGTHYLYNHSYLCEHEGKYLQVINPKKDIAPIDENGNITSGLGIRNYLSNTPIGDFYLTSTPGLIALVCAFISGLILILSLFKENVPVFMTWAYAIPLCFISLLEIGAALSLGTDAAWWVNPDEVGYWIATPLLIPYAIVAALMVFSYKNYGFMGKFDGPANTVVSTLLIIGIGLTVISAIYVIFNFLFAAFMLIGAGWIFKGMEYKDSGGNTINTGPLGTYKTDRYGNTRRIE